MAQPEAHKPVLLLGYGNPSRGDDALGPMLLEMLESDRRDGRAPEIFDTLTDFQLQVEHALDLQRRQLVLFIDASLTAAPPCELARLQPCRDHSFSSHAMSPAAVLAVYEQVCGRPPPAFLLAIRGHGFELGEPLSGPARAHLQHARALVGDLLQHPRPRQWSHRAAIFAG
jgi:hydrogenase maturation protease